jgi:hypothetical protein
MTVANRSLYLVTVKATLSQAQFCVLGPDEALDRHGRTAYAAGLRPTLPTQCLSLFPRNAVTGIDSLT